MSAPAHRATTVGVFDSGVGGLTVLRELLPRLPHAAFHYLGDTARLPYGSKSQATIARFAVESARFLAAEGADLLVIACNTATALALPEIRAAVAVPVVGVIEPAIHAAHTALPGGHILVLATAATVASHAYRRAGEALGLRITEKACPLLVPLIEEAWLDHAVTREVLRIYLEEALNEVHEQARRQPLRSAEEPSADASNAAPAPPAAVVLGCTHYPLIAPLVERTLRELGSQAIVIDSASAAAAATVQALPSATSGRGEQTLRCYATDSVEKFAHLGSLFLGRPLTDVRLLDLGG